MWTTVAAVFALTLVQQPADRLQLRLLQPQRPQSQQLAPQQPQQQTPARDARPPRPRVGTAIIRGRVVDGQTGQPLARARVRIANGPGGATLITDASGSFEFTQLPAGRYGLSLSKRGYMAGTYPESSRTMRGRTGIVVEDGQVLENVTAPLYHGGAITGRLLDAYGDPVDNVSVRVLRTGGRVPQASQSSLSNDLGEFRVSHLQSGSYVLLAMPNGRGDSTEDAPVPTFYPGVLSIDQAQPIGVERGQTVSGMDFQVIEQPVVSVTGMVLDGDGQPAANGNINVENENRFGVGGWSTGAPVRENGTFQLKVAPGEYRLVAYAHRRVAGQSGDAPNRPAQFDDRPQMGMMHLSVGTEPVGGIVIATGDGTSISGRLIFDGDGQPPDPTKIVVGAQSPIAASIEPMNPLGSMECRTTKPPAKVNPDLTFTLEGVRGTCVLSVMSLPQPWHARSAIYRGADLLDRPMNLMDTTAIRGVQLTVTTRRTDLTAQVTDEQGQPSQDYVLVAFSADKARWSLARYSGFAVHVSDPSQLGGIFGGMVTAQSDSIANAVRAGRITSLPPGDYYVAAFEDIAFEDMRDPAMYERLYPTATRVTLRDDEPQTVQVKRLKMPSQPQ